MTKVLGLITARKNSKRVPNKNLKLLWGEPLIIHTFRSAIQSDKLDRILLSTDDDKIIKLTENFPRIEVLFKRPDWLSGDHSSDWEVFDHALTFLNEINYRPELVVHLRPTSPSRTSIHIDSAIDLLIANPDATSVRSVRKIKQSIFKTYFLRDKFLEFIDLPEISSARDLPDQVLPETYGHVGYVDVIRASTIQKLKSMTGDKILPLVIEDSYTGINTFSDFEFYERLK
jgi:CMP-N,N'-diacetyllegionaminic acid synthase